MENENIEKDNKKMTRTDWLLIAVLAVSIADFITRFIKGQLMPRGGYRQGGGRPKGSPNKGTELGRKTIFKSVTISGSPEEVEKIKQLAEASGKSVSRFIIERILSE